MLKTFKVKRSGCRFFWLVISCLLSVQHSYNSTVNTSNQMNNVVFLTYSAEGSQKELIDIPVASLALYRPSQVNNSTSKNFPFHSIKPINWNRNTTTKLNQMYWLKNSLQAFSSPPSPSLSPSPPPPKKKFILPISPKYLLYITRPGKLTITSTHIHSWLA